MKIEFAQTDTELMQCFPVVQELRPHLQPENFIDRVRHQMQNQGYQLVYLESAAVIRSIAGFRLTECLAWGKFLYVDDLVTRSVDRSKGYGDRLFNWLIDYGRTQGCDHLELDSGVQRFSAHRFYMQHRMEITSHHFSLSLESR